KRPGVEVQAGSDRIVLTLEPGLAFGTGGNPSTSLTLAAMDEYFNPSPGLPSRSGVRVLDVGTGSGILALAAAHLGAGPILAVDSSHEAAETAQKNAALSDMASKITVSRTTLDKVSGEFDLILANLVPAVLVRAGKKLPRLLAPEGTMIVAGFADSQTPQIVKAMTKAGLVIIKSYSQAGWAALTFSRPA
ncbi:MAG: 50S ribosomal protein L11 methyltransferase, partial [Thermodesulfobacteriota bacterium]|nr:50S ribosomal protein L11 methyltransferase [Thermodesulfobacteriota bacterium]